MKVQGVVIGVVVGVVMVLPGCGVSTENTTKTTVSKPSASKTVATKKPTSKQIDTTPKLEPTTTVMPMIQNWMTMAQQIKSTVNDNIQASNDLVKVEFGSDQWTSDFNSVKEEIQTLNGIYPSFNSQTATVIQFIHEHNFSKNQVQLNELATSIGKYNEDANIIDGQLDLEYNNNVTAINNLNSGTPTQIPIWTWTKWDNAANDSHQQWDAITSNYDRLLTN